jgi:hypothetical protein
MTWPEAGDILHRWSAVLLFGVAFFRFAFEVAIWPNLLLLLAGSFVAWTLRRRFKGTTQIRFVSLWVLGIALLMAGFWGFVATLGGGNWRDMIRLEPFGQILLGLYILLGIISLFAVKRPDS